MWHGRHHSAQKSTTTGCALLAVRTSDSKLPSLTIRMLLSAMLFAFNGIAYHSLPCFAPSALIRCCNRYLVSCRRPEPAGRARGLIQFGVFRRRCLPGKILGHPVQLDAPPDALVGIVVQRLLHGV